MADPDLSELAASPHRPGVCKSCGTRRYTVFELNVSHGQAGRCYACFDRVRYKEPNHD